MLGQKRSEQLLLPHTMRTAHTNESSRLLKGALFVIATVALVITPLSLQPDDVGTLKIAEAAAPTAAQTAACNKTSGVTRRLTEDPKNPGIYNCTAVQLDGEFDTQYLNPDGTVQERNGVATTVTQTNPANLSGDPAAAPGATTQTDLDKNGKVLPKPTSCASVLTYMTSPFTCMFRSLMSLTAATLIWISSLLLSIAGLLFNWLMDNTVIQFGTFYGTIKVAVETAWTAFRDIANILIIGIFTFVAISIIVGLKEFGQKKMIAHVLIVAVLINFSLLFTKMIIDASNYTAAQIYTAAALGGTNAAGSGNPVGATATASKYGIADQFMNLLGVATFADAYKTVNDIGEAQDTGWATLGHGLLSMVVILAAAMVLFYGCFLLISRMIMLIFLLVTAAIAVASSLVPGWGGGNYGWKAWKSSLLWCVTLAPMLMILLWMTLNVAGAIRGTSKATLGAALSDPATGTNISALFSYVLILGLLFTTFKVSSMWAGKIGGFSFAALAPALGVAGMGRLAGLLGKNTVGRAAGSLSRRASSIGLEHDKLGNSVRGSVFKSIANQLEKPTKRDFNLMNTKFGKDITGIAGLKGGWAGETKGKGVEEDDKKAAEGYARRSEKAAEALKKDLEKDNGAGLKEAAKNIADLPENKEKAKDLRKQKEATEKLLEESKKTREDNKAGHDATLKEAETSKNAAETAIKRSEEKMKTVVGQLERDKEYTPEGSDTRKDMERQIAAARAEHESNQNSQNAKINEAKATVERIASLRKGEADTEAGHQKTLEGIKKKNEDFEEKMKAEALKNVSAHEVAGRLVPGRLTNVTGRNEDNDHLTALTRKNLKESSDEKNIKKILKKQVEESEKKPEATTEKPADH